MPRVELTGGFYEDSALQFSAQTCVNMYPEITSVNEGKGNVKLKNIPGLAFTDARLLTVDEIIAVELYSVTGGIYSGLQEDLYSLYVLRNDIGGGNSDYYLSVGKLPPYLSGLFGLRDEEVIYSGPLLSNVKILITDNGSVLNVIVTSDELSLGYFVAITGQVLPVIQEITDPDYPADVIACAYKDSYFIWATRTTNRFYVSDNFATDPANCVNALDFGVAESNPDNIVGLETLGNELVVFGQRTIEFYYNSGNVDFPFERNSGATQNIGTNASGSISKLDNKLIFIGSDIAGVNLVYVLDGYIPRRVSTHAIENVINKSVTDNVENLISLTSYSHQNSGHFFYSFNIVDIEKTFCYDMSTNLWHTRQFDDLGVTSRYPVESTAYAYGKINTVSRDFRDSQDILLYNFLDNEKYSNSLHRGDLNISDFPMKRARTLAHLTVENKNIQYNSFEMDIQKGVGNVDDPDPEITLSISRDGGMTYGNPRALKMGASGAYKGRVKASMLGMARDAVFKIESSAPVQQEWFTAYVDYEVESE